MLDRSKLPKDIKLYKNIFDEKLDGEIRTGIIT